MDPVRIAYVISHLKVGGTQQHLWELLRRLDRSRFSPRVYCLKRHGAMVNEIERLLKGIYEELLVSGGSSSAGGMLGSRGML